MSARHEERQRCPQGKAFRCQVGIEVHSNSHVSMPLDRTAGSSKFTVFSMLPGRYDHVIPSLSVPNTFTPVLGQVCTCKVNFKLS